jgi:hypothetical protein
VATRRPHGGHRGHCQDEPASRARRRQGFAPPAYRPPLTAPCLAGAQLSIGTPSRPVVAEHPLVRAAFSPIRGVKDQVIQPGAACAAVTFSGRSVPSISQFLQQAPRS